MTFKFNTGIITTPDQHFILHYIERHLKQGIWKNAKSMARYRNSLHFTYNNNEQLVLLDYHNQCKTNLPEFFADLIKQIIEAEINDARGAKGLTWSRDCKVLSRYFSKEVTAGACYEFYEILKSCRKPATAQTPAPKSFPSVMTIQLASDEMCAEFDKEEKAERLAERRFNNLFN